MPFFHAHICSLANLDTGDRNNSQGSHISPVQPGRCYSQQFPRRSPSGQSQTQHSVHLLSEQSAPCFRSVEDSQVPLHTIPLLDSKKPLSLHLSLSAFYCQITTTTETLSFLAESILCHIHVGVCEETTLLHSRGSCYLRLEL